MAWLNRQWLHRRNSKLGAIGIEFARDSMHLVQFGQSRQKQLFVQASQSCAYADSNDKYLYQPNQLKALVKPLLKHASFQGDRVVTVMPSSEISIFSLNYELKSGLSDDAAIAMALKGRIDGNLADYVVDKIPIRRREDENSALAIVALAEKSKVVAHLECLRKAGFKVDALEIGPSAIQRLVSVMHPPENGESVLTINFGCDKSYLSIISGRRLLFDEELDFGEEFLLNTLSSTLGIDPTKVLEQIESFGLATENSSAIVGADVSQTLAHIVRRCFSQMAENVKRAMLYSVAESRGTPVSKIYMLGSIARWRGADTLLSGLLGMPVTNIPDPLALFERKTAMETGVSTVVEANGPFVHTTGEKYRSPELAVATGLALRGLS